MSDTIKRRTPWSEERKAAHKALMQAKLPQLEADAINRSEKFDNFIYKFMFPFLSAYADVAHTKQNTSKWGDRVRFHVTTDGIMIEVSIAWIKKEYGPKAVEAMKKLFKVVQTGGRSIKTGVTYQTKWVINEEIYFAFARAIITQFRKSGKVEASYAWNFLKDAEAYKFAATNYMIGTKKNGLRRVYGVPQSKTMAPQFYFDAIASKRKALREIAAAENVFIIATRETQEQKVARIVAELAARQEKV